MTEAIGNYNFSINSKQFCIDYIKNRKYYFDFWLTIIKIMLPILVGVYFNIFSNIHSIPDLIVPFFIGALVLLYLSNLYGLIIKPTKCFLKYDKHLHSFDLKISHFTSKKIELKKGDTLLVEKIKEQISYDVSSARIYYYTVNHFTSDGVKNELFIINNPSIINKDEFDIVNELDQISKKLMSNISDITGIKTEYIDFLEK